MLTNPLITAVAEQHRGDLITQTGPGSWPAPAATADPAGPSRSSRPRRISDLLRIRTGKKVRHGN
jgi:hypothetical protein